MKGMANLWDSRPAAELLDAGAQVWVGQHVPAAIVHTCRHARTLHQYIAMSSTAAVTSPIQHRNKGVRKLAISKISHSTI